MTEVVVYRTRTIDQEPDAIQLIPQHSDYVIIGTYNLHKETPSNADESATSTSRRSGSLQIMSLETEPTSNESSTLLNVCRRDFDCAIVDLHFHPDDDSLLGAATSTAEIRFFRVLRCEETSETRPGFTIIDLGTVRISEANEQGIFPLITYFQWLPQISLGGAPGLDEKLTVTLAACDAKGDTKLVRTTIPAIKHIGGSQVASPDDSSPKLDCQIEHIHTQQHDLEAWVLTNIPLSPTISTLEPQPQSYLLLTGGDDANILATRYVLETDKTDGSMSVLPAAGALTIKGQHDAGVVCIEPLSFPVEYLRQTSTPSGGSTTIPVLTGSYDDHLRLFFLHQPLSQQEKMRPDCVCEINLSGGVWRVTVLDEYATGQDARMMGVSQESSPDDAFANPEDTNAESSGDWTWNWILLVCTMYDGAKIVRLRLSAPSTSGSTQTQKQIVTQTGREDSTSTHEIPPSPRSSEKQKEKGNWKWTFTVEATFKAGHESMVYGAVGVCIDANTDTNTDTNINTNTNTIPDTNTKTKTKTATNSTKGIQNHNRRTTQQDATIHSTTTTHKSPHGYDHESVGDRAWKIMSTSFYDRKLCTWTWVDQHHRHHRHQRRK